MTIASWFSKMTGTAMTLDNLEKVLLMQLRDLYSAENQLVSALPKMAEAASSSQLKKAFQSHLRETRNQVTRLERAFRLLEAPIESENCDAMKGLIAEGSEIMDLEGEPDVKDAALIAAAQRVEHYEIAGYGCARAFARRLGKSEVAKLLQETIEEEGNADKLLTSIAEAYDYRKTPNRAASDGAAAKNGKRESPRGSSKVTISAPRAKSRRDTVATHRATSARTNSGRKKIAPSAKRRGTKSKA
jgi:ferritin-like metal-binding protein YciE